MPLHVTWYDNAAFKVGYGNRTLWFDPAINKNTGSPVKTKDLKEKADYVLTTHGDPGHYVNSVEVTQKTDAQFLSIEEVCDDVLKKKKVPEDRVVRLKFGENRIGDEMDVFVFEPEHPEMTEEIIKMMAEWGQLVTRNAGFVVRIQNLTLCHIGDAVYSDIFKEIGRRFKIDIGLIPIMGASKGSSPEKSAESGVKILQALKPAIVFPIVHYSKQKNRVDALIEKMKSLSLKTKIIFDNPGTDHIFSEYSPK